MTLYTRDHVTVNTVNPVDVKCVAVQSFSCPSLSMNLSRATFPVKAISPPYSVSCPAVFPLRTSTPVEPGPGALWQERKLTPPQLDRRSQPGQTLGPHAPWLTEPRANKLMVASCSGV